MEDLHRVWNEISDVFDRPGVIPCGEQWLAYCWDCDLRESHMIRRDAYNYIDGHRVSSKHLTNRKNTV